MIIEVDDKTGEATTYQSLNNFAFKHREELKKKYEYKPEIEVLVWNVELLQSLLPEGTSKIIRIVSHTKYIVVNCQNGEIHSLDRTGEYPFFKFYK